MSSLIIKCSVVVLLVFMCLLFSFTCRTDLSFSFSVDLMQKCIDFMQKYIDFMQKCIDFMQKCIDFMQKYDNLFVCCSFCGSSPLMAPGGWRSLLERHYRHSATRQVWTRVLLSIITSALLSSSPFIHLIF